MTYLRLIATLWVVTFLFVIIGCTTAATLHLNTQNSTTADVRSQVQ